MVAESEEHGSGTGILAADLILKVILTAILFPKNYFKNGIGKNITQVNQKTNVTLTT